MFQNQGFLQPILQKLWQIEVRLPILMEVTQYSHFDVNLILSYIKIVLDCQYGLESNELCKIIIRLTCLDIHWIRMGYPSSSGIRVLGSAWVQVNLRKTSSWPSAENEFHHFTVVEVRCKMTRITMGLLKNIRNEKYDKKLFFISEALNMAWNILFASAYQNRFISILSNLIMGNYGMLFLANEVKTVLQFLIILKSQPKNFEVEVN